MSRRRRGTYEHFEALRRRAREQVNRGNLDSALELQDQAITWAEEYGTQEQRDTELCNRGSILVNQGRGENVISALRKILLSSTDPDTCWQAANNIARYHEHRKENRQGVFYARLALDHAKRTGKLEFIARSHNQLGLFLVRQSYFEEAGDYFSEALEVLPPEPSRDRAVLLSNLGYCQTMTGRTDQGFSYLFRSLRMARRRGTEVWEMFPRLSLSFTYLEVDRPARAAVHARRGLRLAEDAEMTWQVKNALYLLGESEKLSGNEFGAYRSFSRLQSEFYPDDPVIPDFLMMTDVRKLINLMA